MFNSCKKENEPSGGVSNTIDSRCKLTAEYVFNDTSIWSVNTYHYLSDGRISSIIGMDSILFRYAVDTVYYYRTNTSSGTATQDTLLIDKTGRTYRSINGNTVKNYTYDAAGYLKQIIISPDKPAKHITE